MWRSNWKGTRITAVDSARAPTTLPNLGRTAFTLSITRLIQKRYFFFFFVKKKSNFSQPKQHNHHLPPLSRFDNCIRFYRRSSGLCDRREVFIQKKARTQRAFDRRRACIGEVDACGRVVDLKPPAQTSEKYTESKTFD
ncbi:hypothetical protein EVAR_42754_1 [Eumeta japonica]|uniref:Uncharacterized protein n=1 Tax=Eumeta variegata TaxID=151549 RepID=A0A4C1WKM5_EUMVA|nr:hypothetical protein EVAR_42754_1 [Eumeta japonica]